MSRRVSAVCLYVFMLLPSGIAAQSVEPWWRDDVEQALKRAGQGRGELEKALRDVPAAQRTGMAFLIANMPDRDLRALRADFLLENVALAYEVCAEVKWVRTIPED